MGGSGPNPVQIDTAENRWHSQHDRDAGREPCPDRIVEDLGSAFGMGCLGGFIWNFCKGYRNSPKGERVAGALFSAKSRAPILGGNFAVWGGTFSAFDCSLQYVRRTDDWVNNVSAGFLTGGVLAARGGWRQAGRNAVMGGVILAVIECVSALLMRSTAKSPKELQEEQLAMEKQQRDWEEAQKLKGGNAGSGGMFGNLAGSFGGSGNGLGGFSSSGSNGSSSGNNGMFGWGTSGGSSSEFATPTSEFADETSLSSGGGFNAGNGGVVTIPAPSSSGSFGDNAGLVPEAGAGGGNGGGESGGRKAGWW